MDNRKRAHRIRIVIIGKNTIQYLDTMIFVDDYASMVLFMHILKLNYLPRLEKFANNVSQFIFQKENHLRSKQADRS